MGWLLLCGTCPEVWLIDEEKLTFPFLGAIKCK